MNTNDPRYSNIRTRLLLLNSVQLQRIIDAKACYDTYNYDIETDTYCPLAHAFGIPDLLFKEGVTPSQDIVLEKLKEIAGPIFGSVRGLAGKFYTDNREADLKELCKEILNEREEV